MSPVPLIYEGWTRLTGSAVLVYSYRVVVDAGVDVVFQVKGCLN